MLLVVICQFLKVLQYIKINSHSGIKAQITPLFINEWTDTKITKLEVITVEA